MKIYKNLQVATILSYICNLSLILITAMMTSIKEVHHLLRILVVVVLFLLCFKTWSIGAEDANTVVVRCIDREREALLLFKRGLLDKSNRLSSWGNEEIKRDCCRWRGVYCNNHTGLVVYLNLSSTNEYDSRITGTISSSLLELRNLNYLDLSDNDFGGMPIPKFIGSLTKLVHLDLSGTNFNGAIPHQLGNLTKLEFLKLSNNYLNESLLDFRGYRSLKSLDLSSNQFTGPLPDFRGCPSLTDLDLYSNQFTGPLPDFRGCPSLTNLRLSYNQLTGPLPDSSSQWIPPFQLDELCLQSCKLGPWFPNWIRTQKKLSRLDLSSNGISDFIPTWFWDLSPRLVDLNLSSNNIRGILSNLTTPGFLSLPFILYSQAYPVIDLSSNSLEGPIPRFLSKAGSLNLSRNKFSGTLSFLQRTTVGFLSVLDVSDNLLSGEIPDCWMHFQDLIVLNLASNNFSGGIPSSFGFLFDLESLILYNNSLSGKLPTSLRNCTTLRFLNVGENNLSGVIPTWIGENLSKLYVLSMHSNKFYGIIPLQLCLLKALRLLDISVNNISGVVPECFNNFTAMIREESQPTISHYSSTSTSALSRQRPVHLRGGLVVHTDSAVVAMKGREYDYEGNLKFLKSIDLSSNNLSGEFPRMITALLELVSFNISNNDIYGNIPPQIGNLKLLESLDLSNNRISGGIPQNMSSLTFLSYLDLSNNNLSGRIPSGTQLRGFNASMYFGNDELCGPPLPQKCRGDDPPISGGNENSGEGTYEFDRGFYIAAALGFSTTFWGLFGALLLNRRWRHAYFLHLNNLKDWIYVIVAVSIPKFQQMF